MTGSAGPAQAPAGPLGLAWCTAYQLRNILIIRPGQAFSGEQESGYGKNTAWGLLLRTVQPPQGPRESQHAILGTHGNRGWGAGGKDDFNKEGFLGAELV